MNACSRNRHAEPEVHPAVGNPPSILFTLKVPLPPERGPALLPLESRRTFFPVCALGLLEKLKKKKKTPPFSCFLVLQCQPCVSSKPVIFLFIPLTDPVNDI